MGWLPCCSSSQKIQVDEGTHEVDLNDGQDRRWVDGELITLGQYLDKSKSGRKYLPKDERAQLEDNFCAFPRQHAMPFYQYGTGTWRPTGRTASAQNENEMNRTKSKNEDLWRHHWCKVFEVIDQSATSDVTLNKIVFSELAAHLKDPVRAFVALLIMDTNHDGVVTFHEFLASGRYQTRLIEQNLRRLFCSGPIEGSLKDRKKSKSSLTLGKEISKSELGELIFAYMDPMLRAEQPPSRESSEDSSTEGAWSTKNKQPTQQPSTSFYRQSMTTLKFPVKKALTNFGFFSSSDSSDSRSSFLGLGGSQKMKKQDDMKKAMTTNFKMKGKMSSYIPDKDDAPLNLSPDKMRLRQEIVNKFCELFPEDADVMSSPEFLVLLRRNYINHPEICSDEEPSTPLQSSSSRFTDGAGF